MQNKISIEVSPQQEAEILQKIAELNAILPEGLVILTEDERQSLAKMGDKSIAFAEKAIDLASQNPLLLPSYVDIDETRKDYNAYMVFHRIIRALEPIVGRLTDSAQLCGNEALISSFSIYIGAKDAEHRSVPGGREAVHELSPRFPGRGVSKVKKGEKKE